MAAIRQSAQGRTTVLVADDDLHTVVQDGEDSVPLGGRQRAYTAERRICGAGSRLVGAHRLRHLRLGLVRRRYDYHL